ncbi:hypothetical protein C5167_004402 [Papaver somniferum]|uniref:F-box/LRR-repeat protein 15/At3g58940/PEG3-like LRR domain-containing protein n=1 Tax=Papaver somniferum TaxID=3469 RepID=A0A4Y7JBC9_PAPSO|nr:hypothetical protein C5167_004402 [Papaver somniferum]
MDRMFILRDLSTIKYFSLLTYIEDEYNINSWISSVTKRKVEEIDLVLLTNSDVYSPFLIPSSLFTCESLIKLSIGVRVVLNLPKYVHFPKLKLLLLHSVRIKDEYFMEQLLSNCPVLEDLSLDSCTWDGIDDLCVSSPTLKRLCITESPCGEININAPGLEYLSYTRFLVKKHVLCSFPVLVNAQIHPAAGNSESNSPEQASNSIKLLGELFNVKHLRVHDRLFKAVALTDDHFLLKLPTFHNLSYLVVIWSYPSSIDRALLRLLQISPKLESLVFHNGNDYQSNKDDSWKLNIVPEGPNIVSGLEHLKVLEFLEFCGDPWEMYVEYFVKKKQIANYYRITNASKRFIQLLMVDLEALEGSGFLVVRTTS